MSVPTKRVRSGHDGIHNDNALEQRRHPPDRFHFPASTTGSAYTPQSPCIDSTKHNNNNNNNIVSSNTYRVSTISTFMSTSPRRHRYFKYCSHNRRLWCIILALQCGAVWLFLVHTLYSSTLKEETKSSRQHNVDNVMKVPSPQNVKKNKNQTNLSTAVTRSEKERSGHNAIRGKGRNSSSSSSSSSSTIRAIFSTSCSPKQDFQSYLLYHSALKVNQPGTVTRIASDCDDDEATMLRTMHKEKIQRMSDKFHLFVTTGDWQTDDFELTKYWNKPFGVQEWMESCSNFGPKHTRTTRKLKYSSPSTRGDDGTTMCPRNVKIKDDDIIILLDPDMAFQRPIDNFFENEKDDSMRFYAEKIKSKVYHQVTQGKPMAQKYSYEDGPDWRKAYGNLTYVVGSDSPVHQLSDEDATLYYEVGPPYILAAKDMDRLVQHWVEFVPRLGDLTDDFMMEMFGYSLAAAHLGLKHQIASGFMVSSVSGGRTEGWKFLKGKESDACRLKKFQNTFPYVLHYCQRYGIGEYFFNKHVLPTAFFTSCDHPLMALPPENLVASVNYSHWGDGSITVWDGEDGNEEIYRYHHAYMTCALMASVNDAATFYKNHHCSTGANYSTAWMHLRKGRSS